MGFYHGMLIRVPGVFDIVSRCNIPEIYIRLYITNGDPYLKQRSTSICMLIQFPETRTTLYSVLIPCQGLMIDSLFTLSPSCIVYHKRITYNDSLFTQQLLSVSVMNDKDVKYISLHALTD